MPDSSRTRRIHPSIPPYVMAVLAFSSVVPIVLTAGPAWADIATVADAGGPYSGCVGAAVQFSGAGSTGNGPLTFAWDFDTSDGIGVDATGPTPSHIYAAAGTYNVRLTVTDSGDPPLSSSDDATVTVVAALGGRVLDQTHQLNLKSNHVFFITFEPNPLSAWSLSDWVQSSTTMTATGYTGSAAPVVADIQSQAGGTYGRLNFSNTSITSLLTPLPPGTFTIAIELRMNLVTGCTVVVPSNIKVKKP